MGKLIRYILVLFLAVAAGKSYGQVRHFVPAPKPRIVRPPQKKVTGVIKKVEVARNRYISQQLNLTDKETADFWPVYEKYQQELTDVFVLKRINTAAPPSSEQTSKGFFYDEKLIAIRKHYNEVFLKILPPEKVNILYKSEHDFKEELFKRLSESGERSGN